MQAASTPEIKLAVYKECDLSKQGFNKRLSFSVIVMDTVGKGDRHGNADTPGPI